MTVDEAEKAKREAENKIFKVLSEFQDATGLQVFGLDVRTLDGGNFGTGRRMLVSSVSIDARV